MLGSMRRRDGLMVCQGAIVHDVTVCPQGAMANGAVRAMDRYRFICLLFPVNKGGPCSAELSHTFRPATPNGQHSAVLHRRQRSSHCFALA